MWYICTTGTLIKGDLDDGRGLSRKAVFRHKHEEETGRTSSVATAYMGFDDSGEQILSKRSGKLMPWVELAKAARKRIQLIDLAGHEKYLKTTVFGLTGMQPDIVVVVIGANMGVKRMTKEHLAIAVAVRFIDRIASWSNCARLTSYAFMSHVRCSAGDSDRGRIDQDRHCAEERREGDAADDSPVTATLYVAFVHVLAHACRSLLPPCGFCPVLADGKMAMLVKTLDQAETAAKSIPSNRITPILPLSNVTGDGLANLRRIFFDASPSALFKATLAATTLATTKSSNQEEALATTSAAASSSSSAAAAAGGAKKSLVNNDVIEMPIDETYQVPGVGFIVAGTLVSGTFKINDMLQIGPDHNGQFHKVIVRSMESMYIPLKELVPGQTAAISIRSVNKKYALNRTTFRKGMVLLSVHVNVHDYVSQVFDARVVILHHQTTVTKGYQPMINCRTIRQTAEIVSIESSQDVIRTGDRALVRFRFIHAPEFLKKGMRFVFRDGQAKGIGKVVRIVPPSQC